MNFYIIVESINTILFIAIGLFVYVRDRKSLVHKTFFRFCLSVSAWTSCYVIWLSSSTYESALFWIRALHVGAVFIPVTYLHHVLTFLKWDKEKKMKFLIKGGYVLSFFLLSISFTPFFVKKIEPELFFPYWPRPGIFYHFFIFYLASYLVYSWYLIYKKSLISSEQERQQMRIILPVAIISMCGGMTNFFLHYHIPIPPFGDFLVPLYPIVTAYMILKYKLFDINVIIRKGLVYSMLIAFLTSVFFALMLIIEKFFQGLLGYEALFITALVGFLLAFGFNPLKNLFQKIVDRRFFSGTLEEIAIENARLRQEMLKQDQMKAVATLAASMAHEIKNPLTVIRTFTDFLPERINDKIFLDNFKRLVKPQVEKINFTVQQLLDFSKPSHPDLKPVNIYYILYETLELLSADFLRKKIKTRIEFSDKDMTILADQNQLKQVFLNLFLNSIDAISGGGELIVSGKAHDNILEIDIQDTGHGISNENLVHIFQPFFTTKPNGTGLGLSVVHDILEQHKASIKVESEEGAGTKFTIIFPYGKKFK